MTGEKDRFKTHEQLWKLDDSELSTPQHDELVLQLLNKKNTEKLLKFIGIEEYEFTNYTDSKEVMKERILKLINGKLQNKESIIEEDRIKIENELDLIVNSIYEFKKERFEDQLYTINLIPVIHNLRSEVPVTSENSKFILGYIDVQFDVKTSVEDLIVCEESNYKIGYTVHKYRFGEDICMEYYDPEIRYLEDIVLNSSRIYKYVPSKTKYSGRFAYKNDEKDITVKIEVKPKIDSFGKTLRQINTYREYDHRAIYVIYSPDTRFKAAFESQGIKFITPSDIGIRM